MDRTFDYNGSIVAPSKPEKKLRTIKKMLVVDSGDRDITKYPTNGDFVVYLPRVYENVISLRLAGAEFPANPVDQSDVAVATTTRYYIIDIEGLNKIDECSVGADRSGYPDGIFAKIPVDSKVNVILYNDHSAPENISKFSPAVGKLDRMHIRTRLHSQKSTGAYIKWPSEYSLTFEIEMLDNGFDDFSSFETRLSSRM